MQLILKYNACVVTDKMIPLAVNKLLLLSYVSGCCEVSQCEALTSVLFRISILGGLDLATFLMPFKKYCIALAFLTCTGRNLFCSWHRLVQEDTQGEREDSPFAMEEPQRIASFGHSSG